MVENLWNTDRVTALDGFGWVQEGALAPSKRKTKQTETQIGSQGIILARVWGGKLFGKDDT